MMAGGYLLLCPPPPVPRQIYIYWFNYRQQVFYEATVPLKKDAAKTMFSLPKPRFGGPVLVTGVKPDGTAVVWVAPSPKGSTHWRWPRCARSLSRRRSQITTPKKSASRSASAAPPPAATSNFSSPKVSSKPISSMVWSVAQSGVICDKLKHFVRLLSEMPSIIPL